VVKNQGMVPAVARHPSASHATEELHRFVTKDRTVVRKT